MRAILSSAALFAVIGAAPALAQQKPSTSAVDPAADRITIGVGPAIGPRYIGSRDTVVVPLVAVQGQVSGHVFGVQGTSLWIDAITEDGAPGWKLQVGPALNVRLDRTSRIGNPQVAALGERDTAWEPGLWAGVQRTGVVTSPYDTLSASVSWQHDVAGAYGGSVVSPVLSYSTPLSHHDYVSLSAGADHVGRRFGHYYYDISDSGSSASGLRAYGGADHAGWKDWNASLLVAHAVHGDLTHGVGLFATAGYQRLLGDYARSPIVADVGNRNQCSGAIGMSVTFR